MTAAVPDTLERPATHRVRLTARAEDDADLSASAWSTVELVARSQAAAAAFHAFPLNVRLATRLDTTRTGAPLALPAVEVWGRGKLWEDDPGILDVRLTSQPVPGRSDLFLAYHRPELGLSLGKQSFAFSPLVQGGHGIGLGGEARFALGSTWLLTPQVALFAGGRGPTAGVAADLRLVDGTGARGDTVFSVQLLSSGRRATSGAITDPRESQVSVRLQHGLPGPVPLTAWLRDVDVEYAASFAGDTPPATALRLAGALTHRAGSLSFAANRTDAGYGDAAMDNRGLRLSGRLRLDEALRLDAPPTRLDAWFARTLTTAPAGPRGFGAGGSATRVTPTRALG